MTFTRVLAQATVSDLERAVDWYATLFDRPPDVRPMEGLVEWHLGDAYGVQVATEPDRSGSSTMVIDESDLDALVSRLDAAGLAHDPVREVTASRLLPLLDPDGNRVFVTGPFA